MPAKKPTFRAVKAAYRAHMKAMAQLGQLIEHAAALQRQGKVKEAKRLEQRIVDAVEARGPR
jgi:hypothetical protein